MSYNVKDFAELTLRDFLAIDRTKLANSRTVLAYIRTALMMVVSAITLMKLFPQFLIMQYFAYILFPIAGLVFIIGLAQYFKFRGKITLEASQLKCEDNK
ncbi:MAG: putative rane protein [Candidatus Cloacimonadota bacterium]|nr:putative rane protein [Candidatus Cloacimonadota bacterium]